MTTCGAAHAAREKVTKPSQQLPEPSAIGVGGWNDHRQASVETGVDGTRQPG